MVSSISTAGLVGDDGIKDKYPILLAWLCGSSLAQNAENPGKPLSILHGMSRSCDMVAALPKRYTRSMYSDVLSARVCKLSTSMILPRALDICLFFAEMRIVGMEVPTRVKSISLLWCWCRDCYCLGVLIIVRGIWVFNDECCCGIETTTL